MDIRDLEAIIARTGDLPAMPAIAVKVMEMVGDPSTSANDLQEIISHDQALTSKVLKIANSAMFGVSRDISTLSHAIMILGFSSIRSIVLATSTKSVYMKTGGASGFSTKLLWDHSLSTALISRTIGSKIPSVNNEEVFIAGLLHDIGKTVMNMNFTSDYEGVITEVYNNKVPFREVEEKLMGFDHTQVGALVLRKWNISQTLEETVLHHHSPKGAKLNQELTAVVSLANIISNLLTKAGEAELELEPVINSDAAEVLGYDEVKIKELTDLVVEMLEEDKDLFNL
jgi:putative nucleotidyltransferase with HDIG domain